MKAQPDIPRRRWTIEEDARLRKLAEEGRSAKTISERLKRSVFGVHWRLSVLGISLIKANGKMIGKEKSTHPGLSATEQKTLRNAAAKEAMSDHQDAQQSFQGNRERLRAERLAREVAAGPALYPAPELPDNTPIDNVRFSARIRKAVMAAGLKTVGEIREASDATLLGVQDLGKGSVFHLRETLGLPSKEGVRPRGPKANK